MPINDATFQVVCTPTPAVGTTTSVDYMTIDETGIAFSDYIMASGTLVFQPGDTTKKIVVPLRSSTTTLTDKRFKLQLSNPQTGTLGNPAVQECQISGPPIISATGWPGPRMALMGDSTTYNNHHWNPPILVQGSTTIHRYEFYATLSSGYFAWANMLASNAMELEPALQPNTNPNGSSPKNGYNFAIYSSQTSQWELLHFDPIPNDTLNNGGPFDNIGPMAAARQYIANYDVIAMLGGTNDISGGKSAASVLNNLKTYAYALAQAGKYVFVFTITPRSADALQNSATGQGYDQAGVAAVMQALLDVNTGIRAWLGGATPVPNIFLVDPWLDLIGTQASIIAGIPTDPGGHLSPASGITMGGLIPSQIGVNFNPSGPGVIMMYDGLHEGPGAGYAMGKRLAAAMVAAGMPAPVAGKLGPLVLNANLCTNSTMASSTTPRNAGQPLLLGRAIGLGTPLGTPTGTGHRDAYTNYGQGYTYGQLPDYFFFYRESNSDSESYSNFMAYTFSSFVTETISPYMVDSTWADGAIRTTLVTSNGKPAIQIDVNIPQTGSKNEGFTLRYLLPEGEHGPWDSFGYEQGAVASTFTPPYTPGDKISAACIVGISGLGTSRLVTCRLATNFLAINNVAINSGDLTTSGAVISGISLAEGFFPFDKIVNIWQHPEDKLLHIRTPVVAAPTPANNENLVYMQVSLQINFDCSHQGATARFIISDWQVNKVTGPTL